MQTSTAKQDRIGARVPHDVYETLCRAAELSGARKSFETVSKSPMQLTGSWGWPLDL